MLTISNLYYAYPQKDLLLDINICISSGNILGLVGPNGSGKTTLINLISGVLKPQTGEIVIDDTPISDLTPQQLATKVSTVPQNPQLPPYLKAIDVVLMGRNCHLKPTRWETQGDLVIAEDALQLTEAWSFRNTEVYKLSGGELQRVMMARAIAQQSPLMLLDEPTANLDLKYQHHILNLIKTLDLKPIVSTIIAIHDITLASQYCDLLAVLNEGKIQHLGTPKEILTSEKVSKIYDIETHIIPHPDTQLPMVIPRISKT